MTCTPRPARGLQRLIATMNRTRDLGASSCFLSCALCFECLPSCLDKVKGRPLEVEGRPRLPNPVRRLYNSYLRNLRLQNLIP